MSIFIKQNNQLKQIKLGEKINNNLIVHDVVDSNYFVDIEKFKMYQEMHELSQIYEIAADNGWLKRDAVSYDFEDLMEMYEDVTGNEIPLEQGELLFGYGKLTYCPYDREDLWAVYNFNTKEIEVNEVEYFKYFNYDESTYTITLKNENEATVNIYDGMIEILI